MSLVEKVVDFGRGIYMNRVTLAMMPIYSSSIYGIMSYQNISNISDEPLRFGLLCCAAVVSGAIAGYTSFGTSTGRMFRKIDRQIETDGCLNREYVTKVMCQPENDCATGYCQIQGIYLAAKKHGKLAEFRKLQEKYSCNKIPHF